MYVHESLLTHMSYQKTLFSYNKWTTKFRKDCSSVLTEVKQMLLKNKTEHETNGPYRLSEQTILLVHCKVYRSINFHYFIYKH